MKKDANVTQVSELRVFAHATSNYAQGMTLECQRGANLCDDAIRSADFFRKMAIRKVETAQQQLDKARRALNDYESQISTDSEGNSNYDAAHIASLRENIEKAEDKLNMAIRDERLVEERYNRVVQEANALVSELNSACNTVSQAGSEAYRQISQAASYLEQYNS